MRKQLFIDETSDIRTPLCGVSYEQVCNDHNYPHGTSPLIKRSIQKSLLHLGQNKVKASSIRTRREDYSSRYNPNDCMSINKYEFDLLSDIRMMSDGNNSTNLDIDGVPSEFINSFGNYVVLKYFLDGIKTERNIYTYNNFNISEEDYRLIRSMFKTCRTIYNNLDTEYEFFDVDLGYCVIQYSKTTKRYSITTAIGYEEFNSVISTCGKNIKTEPTASWVTGVDQYGELEIKKLSIKDIYEYQSDFYPFMNGEDIKDYAARYIESKSSILLLIGPPGTSKTNFIRQLLSATNEGVLLTYSDDLKKADKLFSHFYDSPEKFLIIEDADTYIERREDGNTNMKQLLNITDGLTANPNKKVIFSTNLPNINRVDPALTRPGRCFDKLKFDRLTGDNLSRAMERIGIQYFEGIDIPKDGYTIAELFAIKTGEYIAEKATMATGFGFVR